MKIKRIAVSLFAVSMMASPLAQATNGYFSHGYGMKAKGMGGAATAMSIDAMGGANNPASMVWVGDRLDVGIDWFSPKRAASRSGSSMMKMGDSQDFSENSSSNNFLIPEFGYNKMMNSNMSLGVTVYGNGGMNTDYASGSSIRAGNCGPAAANPFCAPGKLGINMEQLIIAPTIAYKLNENNSIGVSPLIVYQRFGANGLHGFMALSTNPGALTDKGYDSSTGFGVRLGWQGKISDSVKLGAAYAPKVSMDKFSRYAGLFAEAGGFDIPMNWNLGVAFNASPAVTVALDYSHIEYTGVKSVSNSGISMAPGCMPVMPAGPGMGGGCLGNPDGLGFAWGDVDVIKLGVEYKYSNALTLRAGYNRGDNPIKSGEQTFNIIAPGVVTDHYTLGMTYELSKGSEITVSYMHAAEKSVTGPTSPYFPVGGTETIKMYQNSLGIAYGMKF